MSERVESSATASPPTRTQTLRRRVVGSFPARVWHHFSRSNGFLLSAGMSYYMLFAIFALLYVVFAGVGVWLGASPSAITRLIDIINSYVPGLIGEHGLVSPEAVAAIAQDAGGVLSITGAIAVVVGMWTAIGAITFTRRAMRDIFGLPYDDRNFVLLKLRDLLAAAVFGSALLLGSALSTLGVWALTQMFELIGWSTSSWLFNAGVRTLSIVTVFTVNLAALAALARVMSRTSIPWRTILPGAVVGALAMVVLQLALGLLLAYAPSNPLLATFAVIIGLLLWCRWLSLVVLATASWIAVTAEDSDLPLVVEDERAARIAECEALVVAARVRLREAQSRADAAFWYQRLPTRRAVRTAQDELARAEDRLRAERAVKGVPR